jgi:hypothetical protein
MDLRVPHRGAGVVGVEGFGMNRRGFIGSILAAGAAPSIVSSGSLMQIWTPVQVAWLDGMHDDAAAIYAWSTGQRALGADGRLLGDTIQGKHVHVGEGLTLGVVPAGMERTLKSCDLYLGLTKAQHEARVRDLAKHSYVIRVGHMERRHA